jgi:hypothetical protein
MGYNPNSCKSPCLLQFSALHLQPFLQPAEFLNPKFDAATAIQPNLNVYPSNNVHLDEPSCWLIHAGTATMLAAETRSFVFGD